MPLLWLADYAHRLERGSGLAGAKRLRLTLPDSAWLDERLDEGKVHVQRSGRVSEGTQSSAMMVRGLVEVERGSEWRGCLTAWGEEAIIMKEYYLNPADGYTVHIRHIYELSEAKAFHHIVDPKGYVRVAKLNDPLSRPHGFKHADTAALRGVRVGGGGGVARHPGTVGDIIEEWGYQAADLDAALLILVVRPIVELILQRRWSTVLMRACWHHKAFPDYPDPEWAEETKGTYDQRQVAEVTEITHVKMGELMKNLRRWAPAILDASAGDNDERVEEQNSLCLALQLPQRWLALRS